MRARELFEDYAQNLESDLNNLLVGAKGNGSEALNTNDLVDQLNQMGYAVNNQSILTLLTGNPNVTNATPTVINLQTPSDDQAGASSGGGQGGTAGKDPAAQVSDMAQKATKI